MRAMRSRLSTAIAIAVASSCPAAPAIAGDGDPTRKRNALTYGRDLFTGWCSNCHAAEPGRTPFAAPLEGLMGRKAGSVEGFAFSPRIASLDLVWSRETLDAWLAGLATESPTTSIRHVGVSDASDRTALVAYVASLKGE